MNATFAGAGKIDITPQGSVWMDGMLRAHPSEGVHDRLYARAPRVEQRRQSPGRCSRSFRPCVRPGKKERLAGCNRVSKCGRASGRHASSSLPPIPTPARRRWACWCRVKITSSGTLRGKLIALDRRRCPEPLPACQGWRDLRPGRTISHYRRLLADDGHVVMNWEPAIRRSRLYGVAWGGRP